MAKKSATKQSLKRYMLVDGNAIVHRAFHAIAHLSTQGGEPTNAVYGFAVILLRALKEVNPSHVALTFDLAGPTFRHEQYKEYKATRVKGPDELYSQIPRCKEVAAALGIKIYEMPGFEADDLLGTLADKICQSNKGENFEVLIVTGDLDTLQLVNDHVKIYTLRKGMTDVMIYDRKAIDERYGITPEQVVDFKSIKGDPSDNIPGITGIGEKGALDLIKKYSSLKGVYEHLDELKERQAKMFVEQRDQAQMSYQLSQIKCDLPIDGLPEKYSFSEIDYQKIVQLFQELQFKSLIPKLPKVVGSADSNPGLKELKEIAAQPQAERSNDNYTLVDSNAKLEKLVSQLAKAKEFAFDTETNGLGAFDYDLVGLGLAYQPEKAYYIPANLLADKEFGGLRKIFADPKIAKIAHNIKYDYLVLKKIGIDVCGTYFDTMVASYLLSPGSRAHSLDTIVFNEFGYQMQPIDELIGKGKTQITMAEVESEKASFYCCEDVDYTFRLKHLLEPRLAKENLQKVFTEIDMPLVKILAEMEENGILLDTKLFAGLEKTVEASLQNLQREIYKQAGREFNINSPAQLKEILFDEMKISEGSDLFIKKTKSGFSTAAAELEKMRDLAPIIALILDYRELAKLQSTYILALPLLVSNRDGRLHTSFNQTVAATGRLSSSNPNLQNIPVSSGGIAAEIRKGFVAAKGYKLLSIDYSQIELRVVAHLSGDKTMAEVFKNGEDIHAATAMRVYGIKDADKISKEMRRSAKTINFGVLYGVSSFGLSERVEMSRAEAAKFIKKYFQEFPAVDKYLKEVIEQTQRAGFVENELGRRRYLPEINSSQFQVRSGAERAAINMPMQSLAADIIKIAMQNIAKEIDIQSEQIRMLLQVHDELVFEVRQDLVSEYAPRLKKIMESAYKLKVPLEVEVKVGPNWSEMKPL